MLAPPALQAPADKKGGKVKATSWLGEREGFCTGEEGEQRQGAQPPYLWPQFPSLELAPGDGPAGECCTW